MSGRTRKREEGARESGDMDDEVAALTTERITHLQSRLRSEGLAESTIKAHMAHLKAALPLTPCSPFVIAIRITIDCGGFVDVLTFAVLSVWRNVKRGLG